MDNEKYKQAIIAAVALTNVLFSSDSKMHRSQAFVSFLIGGVLDNDLELARKIYRVYGTSKMPNCLCTPSLPGRL